MAFTTEAVTSISDLVTKLDAWMALNGWTSEHLDITTTAGTGGEWAMRRVETLPAAQTGIDGTTQVDDVNEEFDITTHGFSTGQFVRYDNGGGATITGLVDGQHYYVNAVSANSFSLHNSLAEATGDTNRVGLTDTVTSLSEFHPVGYQIRFAASWDAANSGELLAIYNYADQNYVVGDRPWGQDHDSGNGFGASTPDTSIDDDRHVDIGTAPQRYWAFESDHYTHIVVKTSDTQYQHFGFGLLDKLGGDWLGGEYAYGQRNNLTIFASSSTFFDGMTFLLDGHVNDTTDGGGLSNGMEQFAATIRCVDMPNQATNGMWAVCMGGKQGSPQTDFGLDRQSNDGASSDTDRELMTWGLRAGIMPSQYYRFDGLDVSGHTAMWPVAVTYVDTTTGDIHGTPLARMKDVAGINIRTYEAEQEITLAGGSETWMIFPANKKAVTPFNQTGTTGFLGIAYKKVT